MPLIDASTYRPPILFRQGDFHTIAPALFRKVRGFAYQRERVEMPDGDFMDLDFAPENKGGRSIVLLIHGLEGNASSPYMEGLCRALNGAGFDAVSMNFRNCSGEPNRKLISYHSGRTEDLDFLLDYLQDKGYEDLVLVGFSLGGNVTLKYAGEGGGKMRPEVKTVVAVATPCDIAGSVAHLQRSRNWIYMRRFMKTLRQKAVEKKLQFPEAPYTVAEARAMRNFEDHDNLYTAPVHGFKNAQHYYKVAASKQYLNDIKVPALIVNALDDPFLTPSCMPIEEARRSKLLHLELPRYGGHVGFARSALFKGHFWHEERILNWLGELGLQGDPK